MREQIIDSLRWWLLYRIYWLGFNVWCSQWLLFKLWVDGHLLISL